MLYKFGFGLGWIWVLIASVPDLCILFTRIGTSRTISEEKKHSFIFIVLFCSK